MVDTGLVALALGGGTLLAYETGILGSGSQSGDGSTARRGGFSGLPATAQGYGVPEINRTTVTKKSVDYSPTSVNKTVNVNTQPRAGSGTKKEESSDSSGGEGSEPTKNGKTTKKESNSSKDISRVPQGQDDSGDGSPHTDTGIQASDTPGVQSKKPGKVTQELNQQQGYTRTATSTELGTTPDIGGGKTKKESKSTGGNIITKQFDDTKGGGFADVIGGAIGW